MKKERTIFIINDNHFITKREKSAFEGSKFHLFLKGFNKSNVFLSSPSQDNDNHNPVSIDGINILPRQGYGKAFNFYKYLPFNFFRHYKSLKQHVYTADTVLLVAPACTLPISYFICRLLKKPIALYIVGDVIEVVSQTHTQPIFTSLFKSFITNWEWKVTKFITKRHITFTLGSSLYKKLAPLAYDLRPAMTSLVADSSIVEPQITKFKEPIKLLSVSRLSPEKGIHLALEAIANLRTTYNIIYTIIGDGPEKDSLKKQVSELKINEKIVFTGYLDQQEIRTHYLSADIFILPSLSEGIPKVILDAMATATPVISTSAGGIPDLLSKDQDRGWLVKPNDVKAIQSALSDCISQDSTRNKKLLNAHEYIKQHTLEKEAGRIESALLELTR